MHSLPIVSVVVPLYNKAVYVERLLDSVLNQSFRRFELIIVDDGSTDGGADLVQNVHDPRIRLIRQVNSGVSAARNRGASEATGDFLVFLDADDYWSSQFLEVMLTAFDSPNVVWAMCGERRMRVIEDNPRDVDVLAAPVFDRKNFFELFLHDQVGCPGTIVMRRSIFDASRGFIAGINNGEDVEMWLRLALRYPDIHFCAEQLVIYTVAAPGGATVQRRSETSLVSFWSAMAALFEESKHTNSHDLFERCFNKFANKSYRFYVRSGYFVAAEFLCGLEAYWPCGLNRLVGWLPIRISRVLLNLLHQARCAVQ